MSETPTPGYATSDWAGAAADRWARNADRLEAQLEPVSDVLFAAARLTAGQRVLDVGCGRGATTRRAAGEVGPSGVAIGIDVAENLIDEAKGLAADTTNIDWIVADAQQHRFTQPLFDAVISRFGVMFFDDAVAAFSNLRTATRSDASLTAAVWQVRYGCPLFEVPLAIGRELAANAGVVVNTDAVPANGGPFAFGDVDFVRETLTAAGWRNVAFDEQRLPLYNGGPGTVAEAVDVSLAIGPLRLTLDVATEEQRTAVRVGLIDALTPYHDGIGVRLDGAIAIVSATS